MTSNPKAETYAPSRQQPTWHVIVLSVFSLTLYLFYWYYKTVRDMRGKAIELSKDGNSPPPPLDSYHKKHPVGAVAFLFAQFLIGYFLMHISPDPTTKLIGAFVPLIVLVMYTLLFKDILKLAAKPGTLGAQQPLLVAVLLTLAIVACWVLSSSFGGALFLAFNLSCLPVAYAQGCLNDYWKRNEPDNALPRGAFSALEIVAIIIGSMALGLVGVGMMMQK